MGIIKNNAVGVKKKKRIESIDILKGISIFWIIGGHLTPVWLMPNSVWIYEMLYIFFLSNVGPANFIMLSGLNIVLSINSKIDSGLPMHKIRINTMKRIAVLFIFSILYNYLMSIMTKGLYGVNWYDFYAWYILQIISVSVILTIYVLRINKIIRFLISIFIIMFAYPLYTWISQLGVVGAGISFALYYPFPDIFWAFPFLPWSACAFIGCIIGEYFYNVIYRADENKKKSVLKKFLIYLSILGLTFVLISIIFGSNGPTNADKFWYDIAIFHIQKLNTAPFFNLSTLSYMFLPTHWTYMFYALGCDFLMLSILAFLSDYKNYRNKVFNSLSFAGKVSFSIFIYHHFGIPLFPQTFDFIWIWPAWVGFAIFLIFIIWVDVKKFNGVGMNKI